MRGKERKSRREFCLSSRGRSVHRPVPRKTGNVCPFFCTLRFCSSETSVLFKNARPRLPLKANEFPFIERKPLRLGSVTCMQSSAVSSFVANILQRTASSSRRGGVSSSSFSRLMFRASPWISYDPNGTRPPDQPTTSQSSTINFSANSMDDVDMDAPQISTLREDLSPPPNQNAASHVSKFRVRLRLPEQGTPSTGKEKTSSGKESPPEMTTAASSLAGSSPLKRQAGESEEDEEEEDDEEEDQLADDDDLPATSNPPSSATGTPVRGTAKSRGTRAVNRGGRGKAKAPRGAPPSSSPEKKHEGWFEVSPPLGQDSRMSPSTQADTGSVGPGSPSPAKAQRKKGARKTQTSGGIVKASRKTAQR